MKVAFPQVPSHMLSHESDPAKRGSWTLLRFMTVVPIFPYLSRFFLSIPNPPIIRCYWPRQSLLVARSPEQCYLWNFLGSINFSLRVPHYYFASPSHYIHENWRCHLFDRFLLAVITVQLDHPIIVRLNHPRNKIFPRCFSRWVGVPNFLMLAFLASNYQKLVTSLL